MNVLGLITEYNPFHNGHLYHLQKSKELTGASHTIAVMSGNFLQRGEAALMDKWARAQGAILNGVDLVIEIPLAYACRSAQGFAFGSIVLLESCNIVNDFCFGSEAGDIEVLKLIAQIVLEEPAIYREYLKTDLQRGVIYPIARENALKYYFSKINKNNLDKFEKVLSSPNNILGIEYLRALQLIGSKMNPATITRKNAGYNDPIEKDTSIASATGIRSKIKEDLVTSIPLNIILDNLKSYLPDKTLEIMKKQAEIGQFPVLTEQLSLPLLWILRSSNIEEIEKIHDINEGLENRILEGANYSNNYNDLLTFLKTKRYTLTRIKRILLYILLKYSKEMVREFDDNGGPQYIRVLGFNEKGQEILHEIRKKATLPIITLGREANNLPSIGKKMFQLDVQGTNLYSLLYPNPEQHKGSRDYLEKPIIAK